MHKFMLLTAGASAIALAVPSAFETYRERLAADRIEAIEPAGDVVQAALEQAPPLASGSGKVAQLIADRSGHYQVDARINGRSVPVLVDTGATYVSMNEEAARRLGIAPKTSDYIHKAQTANGVTAVALVTIDRIQIGNVEVRNVEAMVSKGDGLPITLLGMSFLGKLKRFGVEGDRLSLVQ